MPINIQDGKSDQRLILASDIPHNVNHLNLQFLVSHSVVSLLSGIWNDITNLLRKIKQLEPGIRCLAYVKKKSTDEFLWTERWMQ